MYVGDVRDGSGLHHLLDEVVNNALEESWAGHCNSIQIELNADGSATVRDNGRGIPTQTWRGDPIPHLIMTQLHCGGRFDQPPGGLAQLRGVGLVVVNALSEKLETRIWRDAIEHYISFRRGIVETPLTIVGSTPRRGTELIFSPDPEIFPSVQFDFERIEQRLSSLAKLDLRVIISMLDSRPEQPRQITLQL
jgi:DNA gyrase subunit B